MGLFSDFDASEAKTDRVDLPAALTEHLAEAIIRASVGGVEAALSLASLVRQMRAASNPRRRALALGVLRELATVDASMTETLRSVRSARDAVKRAAEALTVKLAPKP